MRIRLAIAAVVILTSCGNKRQKRTTDAAPVEIVTARPSDGAVAAASDEVEPNDGDDTATVLDLGTVLRGRIEPDTDTDVFKLTVAEAGMLALDVSAVDGVDLILELEDAGGTLLARSDRGAAKVREGMPNVGVQPGVYRATVKAKKPPPAKTKKGKKAPPPDAAVGPAPGYEISARMAAAAPGYEYEPDDDSGTANDLIVGDRASGWLGWSGDADVWKLSVEALSGQNAIDVEIAAVDGVALTAVLADGIGQPLVTRKAPRGAALAIRGLVPIVPPGAPPFHYLTLKGDRSNPDAVYVVQVSAKVPGQDAEIEPNDAPDRPMPIPSDRTIVHATWQPGDLDCFAVAPDSQPRTLDFTIDTPDAADLNAELFVDGASVGKAEQKGKGVLEKVSGVVPANGKAVVCVKGSDASADSAYDVSVAEGAAP